jgi:plasmid rolling circle replication initiator protein Rep
MKFGRKRCRFQVGEHARSLTEVEIFVRAGRIMTRICALNLSRAFGAMRRNLLKSHRQQDTLCQAHHLRSPGCFVGICKGFRKLAVH